MNLNLTYCKIQCVQWNILKITHHSQLMYLVILHCTQSEMVHDNMGIVNKSEEEQRVHILLLPVERWKLWSMNWGGADTTQCFMYFAFSPT
jgi:hypothetical protein